MKQSSNMEDSAVWTQMLRYLDGSLPEQEVHALNTRLKNDAELRESFQDLMLQQIKFQEVAQEEQAAAETAAELEELKTIENIVPLQSATECGTDTTPARRARSRNWVKGLALAACLSLLAVAIWLVLLPTKVATLAAVDGKVKVERGWFTWSATEGMVLRDGDRLLTPESGRAMFSYLSESTEVTVHDGTELRLILEGGSKQLILHEGSFLADVAKQDPDRPLKLITPQTEAVVVGTRFQLSSVDASTKLEVFEGAVRVRQPADDSFMHVPAGHFVDVVTDRLTALQPLPRSRGGVWLEHWGQTMTGKPGHVQLDRLMFSGVGVEPGISRVRGFLHPPLNGAYLFVVDANASVEMKLSDGDEVAGAQTVLKSEGPNTDSLSSEPKILEEGKPYYFELHWKTESKPVNFTVSWVMPGGARRVVYSDSLSPFEDAQ